MLRAQTETVANCPNNATSSTTGHENDFARHFLGVSVRESRGWAHGAVRQGSIDDSTGRPGCAVSLEISVTSRTAPVAQEALATVPLVREKEDIQMVTSPQPITKYRSSGMPTNALPGDRGAHPVDNLRRRRTRSRGASLAWMRQGHAAAGSPQADDVDTQIQQGSQEPGALVHGPCTWPVEQGISHPMRSSGAWRVGSHGTHLRT